MEKRRLENLSEVQLIERFLKYREDEVFEEMYKRYSDRIYNYMKRFLYRIPDDMIRELLNEVFIKVYINLEQLKELSTFKKWIYSIAHNICINYLKTQNYIAKLDSSTLETISDKRIDIEKEYINNEIREFIFNEILKLEDELREIVILKFYQNLTYEEISDIMKIPVRTLKYKMRNALDILGKKLKTAGLY